MSLLLLMRSGMCTPLLELLLAPLLAQQVRTRPVTANGQACACTPAMSSCCR